MPSSKWAAPGADWYHSRWTKAATIVPPENQGRSQLGERLAAGEQAADAGRLAEHLVEGERDEVRVPAGQVEPVGRHERGGVEQHVPAVRVRLLDPVERVLDAGEVRLGRVGEEVVVLAADLGQVARQQLLVDAQLGRLARDVGRLGAAGAGELADAVDRVVVVEGEQEAVARRGTGRPRRRAGARRWRSA